MTVTKEARVIIAEMVREFERFNEQTAILSDRETSSALAIKTGAARESTKARILGCANRLTKEVTAKPKRERLSTVKQVVERRGGRLIDAMQYDVAQEITSKGRTE